MYRRFQLEQSTYTTSSHVLRTDLDDAMLQ